MKGGVRIAEQLTDRVMEQRRELQPLIEKAKEGNKKFALRHNRYITDGNVLMFDSEKKPW